MNEAAIILDWLTKRTPETKDADVSYIKNKLLSNIKDIQFVVNILNGVDYLSVNCDCLVAVLEHTGYNFHPSVREARNRFAERLKGRLMLEWGTDRALKELRLRGVLDVFCTFGCYGKCRLRNVYR